MLLASALPKMPDDIQVNLSLLIWLGLITISVVLEVAVQSPASKNIEGLDVSGPAKQYVQFLNCVPTGPPKIFENHSSISNWCVEPPPGSLCVRKTAPWATIVRSSGSSFTRLILNPSIFSATSLGRFTVNSTPKDFNAALPPTRVHTGNILF